MRLTRIVLAIVLLLAVGLGAGLLWLRGSLPQVDGTLALAGLAAPVEIVRDRHAVPHIFAANRRDAAFALGFVHAQDRLWQMEMFRRLGAGRLSEVLGERALPIDRYLRVLGFRRAAEAALPRLPAEERALLDAYAAGVNAFLDSRGGPLPPEFLIFRLTPEPWQPADSLTWSKVMSLELSGNLRGELLRARLAARLPLERIEELFEIDGADGPIGPVVLPPGQRQGRAGRPATGAGLDEGLGSNAWAVGGARSATGRPLLANDPHLGLSAPSLWYFAHMAWPDYDGIGATAPGLPVVVLGRNRRIAWGFTNNGADVQDLYLERLDPEDANRYLTPAGSQPFQTREETIEVRGSQPVRLLVRESRHGPVISDVHEPAARAVAKGHVLALAWTATSAADRTAQAAFELMLAGDWEAFLRASRLFDVPMQNVHYADVDGNIGFVAAGQVPVRGNAEDRGRMPKPGWLAGNDWQGWLPFEVLPKVLNPPQAMLASANHRIVGEDYPHFLADEWMDAYRARRIFELLNGRPHHSLESFKEMQADTLSPMARQLLPLMLRQPPKGPVAQEVHAMLAAWDGRMTANHAEPLIFEAWYRELTRLVYADDLGELFDEAWSKRPAFMRRALAEETDWCDDQATPTRESCGELAGRALELALDDLGERHGRDRSRWRWGEAHRALSEHRTLGSLPVIGRFFNISVPSGGGSHSINVGHNRMSDPNEPFANRTAASLRAIYDLDEPDRSLFMHTTGQSGNPLSAHYRDFAAPWAAGEYIAMTTRRAEIELGALGRLTLTPVR